MVETGLRSALMPKKRESTDALVQIGAIFSVFLIIVAIIVYFVIGNLSKSAQEETQTIIENIKNSTKDKIEAESELMKYKKKVSLFNELLSKHKTPSKVFNFLEAGIMPEISLSSAKANLLEGQMTLMGTAPTFLAVGKQYKVFQQSSDVAKVVVESVGMAQNKKINFSFVIHFNPEVINQKLSNQ